MQAVRRGFRSLALPRRHEQRRGSRGALRGVDVDPLGRTSLSIFYPAKGMVPDDEQEKAIAVRLPMKPKAGAGHGS